MTKIEPEEFHNIIDSYEEETRPSREQSIIKQIKQLVST